MGNKYYIGQPLLKTNPYVFGMIIGINNNNFTLPFFVEWYYTLETTYNHDKLIERASHSQRNIDKCIASYAAYRKII